MAAEHSGPYPGERTEAVLEYIAEQDPRYVPTREIADAVDADAEYVSNSMTTLKRRGLVESKWRRGSCKPEKMYRLTDDAARELFDYL